MSDTEAPAIAHARGVAGSVPVPVFDDLYREEYPALVAVAVAMVGDRELALDLVHDTMVKALVRWDRVSTLDSPGGWCHHVLVNACRSRLRRRVTELRYLARQRRTDEPVPELSAEAIAFWDAVRTLPHRQRSVVALRYAADLTSRQIGEVLGIPEGTVRSDLSAARRTVLSLLGGPNDG